MRFTSWWETRATWSIIEVKNSREVSYDEGLEYVQNENLDIFFETSAKTGQNIDKVFYEAAKEILERRKKIGNINPSFRKEFQEQ